MSAVTGLQAEVRLGGSHRAAQGRLGYAERVHGGALVQIAAFGPKATPDLGVFDPLEIPDGQGIVGHVARHRTLERIIDTRWDPRYIRDSFSGLSEVAIPIVSVSGELVGVLDTEAK